VTNNNFVSKSLYIPIIEEVVMEKEPIVDQCKGCGKIVSNITNNEITNVVCAMYLMPNSKWRIGNCPGATHLEKEILEIKKVDPLKASKMKMKKRR
jgi:hypothetical protein